jgi:hypothetical protein
MAEVNLSGASAGAQAAVFALGHEVFACREAQTACGIRATAVAKRTARFAHYGPGTTLGAEHERSPFSQGRQFIG